MVSVNIAEEATASALIGWRRLLCFHSFLIVSTVLGMFNKIVGMDLVWLLVSGTMIFFAASVIPKVTGLFIRK